MMPKTIWVLAYEIPWEGWEEPLIAFTNEQEALTYSNNRGSPDVFKTMLYDTAEEAQKEGLDNVPG